MDTLRIEDFILKIDAKNDKNTTTSTAFFINPTGWAISTFHAIEGANQIDGFMRNGNGLFENNIELEIVKHNKQLDIALLKPLEPIIHATEFICFEPNYKVGSKVISYGFKQKNGGPGQGEIIGEQVLSESKKRVIKLDNANSMSNGFSGAPILEIKSTCVIGMGLSMPETDENNRDQNVFFALPAQTIIHWLNEIGIPICSNDKILIKHEHIQEKFIELLVSAFEDDYNTICDFGIKNFGFTIGNIPRDIKTNVQLCGYIFGKVKHSTENNKWIKFINLFNNDSHKTFYNKYVAFFTSINEEKGY